MEGRGALGIDEVKARREIRRKVEERTPSLMSWLKPRPTKNLKGRVKNRTLYTPMGPAPPRVSVLLGAK